MSSLSNLKHTDEDKDTLERKTFLPEKQNSVKCLRPRKEIMIRTSGIFELLDQFKKHEFFSFYKNAINEKNCHASLDLNIADLSF